MKRFDRPLRTTAAFLALMVLIACFAACASVAPHPGEGVPSPSAALPSSAPLSVIESDAAQSGTAPALASAAQSHSPQPQQTTAPTPAPADDERPDTKPYTIGWLSDTQYYSMYFPDHFFTMTRYLNASAEELNLGYIAHTGDIVNRHGKKAQWKIARAAMDELNVPHGVLSGNHDQSESGDIENYSEYFGEKRFSDKAYYGGSYDDNRAHYDLITLGSTDFIFVYLSYNSGEELMDWANGVFRKHPERVGVLCVHDYFDAASVLLESGARLQQRVVAANPNVYLVLAGHRCTQDVVPIRFNDGPGYKERTVYQCIADYQDLDEGGQGYIRFLKVDEASGMIRFYTYSPVLNSFRGPPESATNKQEIWPIPWKVG